MDIIERKSYYDNVKPRPPLSSYKTHVSSSPVNDRPDFKKKALGSLLSEKKRALYETENIKKQLSKTSSVGENKNIGNHYSESTYKEFIKKPSINVFDYTLKNKTFNIHAQEANINKWKSSIELNKNIERSCDIDINQVSNKIQDKLTINTSNKKSSTKEKNSLNENYFDQNLNNGLKKTKNLKGLKISSIPSNQASINSTPSTYKNNSNGSSACSLKQYAPSFKTRTSYEESERKVPTTNCNLNKEFSSSRRMLPQVNLPEKALEEKRIILSKKLEKKIIKKVSQKTRVHELSCVDDVENCSMTSNEVAGILATADPMGVCEQDYEDQTSDLSDDETDLYKSKANKITSLFDVMKDDTDSCDEKLTDTKFPSYILTEVGSGFNNACETDLKGFKPYYKQSSDLSSKDSFYDEENSQSNQHYNNSTQYISLFDILLSKKFILKPISISARFLNKKRALLKQNNDFISKAHENIFKVSVKPFSLNIPAKNRGNFDRNTSTQDLALFFDESFPENSTRDDHILKNDILLEIDGSDVTKQPCVYLHKTIKQLQNLCEDVRLVVAREIV